MPDKESGVQREERMRNIKGIKCEPGYIRKQKVFQSLMLLLYVAVGVGLFVAGLLLTGTRANVFTVLGILMVLPGAKRVIALVLMLPRRSVEEERYHKMKETISEEAALLADYVFTSPEKVMSFDFVIVQNQNVMGILSEKKQDVKYITEYLQKGVDDTASGYRVKIFYSDDEFYGFYRRMTAGNEKKEYDKAEEEKQNAVVKYLKILAV